MAVTIILILLLYIAIKTIVPFSAGYFGSSGNNDLIGVLGVLLAFVTIVGGGVYYVIRKANESRLETISTYIEKLANDERIASLASSELTSALDLYFVHKFTYEDEDIMKNLFKVHKESGFIQQSIKFGEIAQKRFDRLEGKDKYTKLLLRIKNNLAIFLAFRFQPTEEDAKKADALCQEIDQLIKENEKNESLFSGPYVRDACSRAIALRWIL
ncbi:MAG: hypothetical protein A3J10_02570 [Candidatus Sungbacteria bacterium RIFCSPLOWO2_02_FULL_54_10]|nr:MAG: hypothetical protein A3J10_02570 [Candidatus Sungbacteria bacterium RIFCSPLOWO2_02_FULL_54_10]